MNVLQSNNTKCSRCNNINICKYVESINDLYARGILGNHECFYFYAKSNNISSASNDTVTSSRIDNIVNEYNENHGNESDIDMIQKQLHHGKCHCCGKEGKVITCSICGKDTCLNCAELVSDITSTDTDSEEKFVCRLCDDNDDTVEYVIPADF